MGAPGLGSWNLECMHLDNMTSISTKSMNLGTEFHYAAFRVRLDLPEKTMCSTKNHHPLNTHLFLNTYHYYCRSLRRFFNASPIMLGSGTAIKGRSTASFANNARSIAAICDLSGTLLSALISEMDAPRLVQRPLRPMRCTKVSGSGLGDVVNATEN